MQLTIFLTHNYSRYAERTGSYPQTRSYNAQKNGDFSRRVIDALFCLATMDWTWIFAVLRGTTYLQPTVKAPSSCHQWFGNSGPFSGGRGPSSNSRMIAAEKGHLDVINKLIQNGDDIHVENEVCQNFPRKTDTPGCKRDSGYLINSID